MRLPYLRLGNVLGSRYSFRNFKLQFLFSMTEVYLHACLVAAELVQTETITYPGAEWVVGALGDLHAGGHGRDGGGGHGGGGHGGEGVQGGGGREAAGGDSGEIDVGDNVFDGSNGRVDCADGGVEGAGVVAGRYGGLG